MRCLLRNSLLVVLLLILSITFAALLNTPAPSQSRKPLEEAAIRGRVTGGDRPIAGARVRIKGDTAFVLTDSDGRFRLPASAKENIRTTASSDGYFIAGADAAKGETKIHLTPLPEDFSDYHWIDPSPDPKGKHNCANCHDKIFREWKLSAHSRAASGRRLMNLYEGTDWHGRKDKGWNLLAEHPNGAGVCAACHAPTYDLDDPRGDDLRRLTGVAKLGVHCDFCHKVADAPGDITSLDHGRFGLKLLRPEEGQLFFGPLDDVDRGEDAFSPLMSESRYCASCHEGTVFGVHVYSTYSEWLASDARRRGKQCQSCHMTPTGEMTNIAPGRGGIERDPKTLASHTFMPGGKKSMLEKCLSITPHIERSDTAVTVNVEIIAKDVGHRVPTGFITRHLLLVVEAFDKDNQLVKAEMGPALPVAAGTLAGAPGVLFAKLLANDKGHPIPFWQAADDPVDTRLTPLKPVRTTHRFPGEAKAVRIRLIYRSFWEKVAEEKAWPGNEIVVFDQMLTE